MARLTNTQADYFARASSWACPVPGASYINFFGGAVENTARNLAPGGAGARVFGDPPVSDDFVTLENGEHYVDTRVAQPSGDMTLIAVARSVTDDDGDAYLISNNGSANLTAGSGTTVGVSLYIESGADGDDNQSLRFGAEKTAGGFEQASIGGFEFPQAHPHICVGRYTAGTGLREANDLTDDLSATLINATGILTGESLWVGSKRTGNGAAFEMYAAMIFPFRLTDAQLALIETAVRAHYAARSITV